MQERVLTDRMPSGKARAARAGATHLDPRLRPLLSRGMLQALHALTNFGADDDLILLRVASALRKMTSADPSMVHTLLEERVLPAVVAMCSSNLESIRHEALGVLYNVALVPKLGRGSSCQKGRLSSRKRIVTARAQALTT